MTQNIIEIKGINKFFGKDVNRVHILKDINIEIKKGDFVAIIGQSGSGKSTLMNIIGCLDTPTFGSYKINDVEVGQMESDELADLRCKTFGFIFQRYNLLNSLNAIENAALPAIYSGIESEERNTRSAKLLSELNLHDKLINKPNELSGGQQQRVSIARALMNGGEIILADEPTGALDSKSGEMVMAIIKDLHSKGHTIILVTHDKGIANQASRVIEIKDGVVISDKRLNDNINKLEETKVLKIRTKFAYLKYRFMEAFRMSVQAILAHKMRSLLTMLGIIIGIASVVSVVALGNGSREQILKQISSMGTNTIQVFPGTSFGDMRSGKIKTLKIKDADFLLKQSFVSSISPNVSSAGILIYENISSTAQLSGVGEQFFDVRGKNIELGRIFTKKEVSSLASVAVIDYNTKKELFPNVENPIGSIVLFKQKPLMIIGVLEEENSTGMGSNMLTLYTPYTTVLYKIVGGRDISSLTIKIKDSINSQVAEDSITKILMALHNGKKDFFMINSDSIKQTIEETTQTMTLLISSIAMISLLVGGIGVMNIMLVSVTERTKEIGIRMAIGAKKGDILQQFLIEAILICLIGGILGISFSLLVGVVIEKLMGDFTMFYSAGSIILALTCSTFIGVIFGYMPAKNAANLNPIEALARE